MGGAPSNLRSNPLIFKLATDLAGKGSAIVMNEDGDMGMYNRANRSLHHFLENGYPLVAMLPASAFLYPFPSFVCMALCLVGRVAHQIGYSGGYGGHGLGFVLDRLGLFTVNGLMIVAFTKMVL